MSAILYYGEPNGASFTVLAALEESRLNIETRYLDLLSGARHRIVGLTDRVALDMGVEGEGPVLVINGEAMTESVFIAQYLDEAGAGHMQPKDAHTHWQMLMWCRRVTERAAPAAAFLGCRSNAHTKLAAISEAAFADLTAHIVSPDLKARWEALRRGDFQQAQEEDSIAKISDLAALCNTQLGDGRDWLIGDYSIADLVTYGWLAGMRGIVPDAFADRSKLAVWFARVEARPSVQRALAHAIAAHPGQHWAPGPEINRWG